MIRLSPTRHVDTFTRDNLPPLSQWPEILASTSDVVYPSVLNCAQELLDRTCAELGPDRRCLVAADGQTWTYGEVVARSSQVARLLVEELGIVPGNRVLLRGPNSPWLAICWLGIVKAGAVAVTTMPLLRAGELRTVVEMAEVKAGLCDVRFLDDLRGAVGDDFSIVPYGSNGPDETVARGSTAEEFESHQTAADDVCILAFTSGTTGQPKATMHFHRDVLAIADTFSKRVLRPRPEDLFAGSPPLAFTFGLGGLLVFPLRAGAAALLLEQASPDQLVECAARHRASVLFTSPTGYRAMTPRLDDFDLTSLRRCVSAGEPLPRATRAAFENATGVHLIDGLGSTEMLHIFITAADHDIRPGATGRVVPGYQAAVLDDAGQPVPDGAVGNLAVKGPTGCRYLRGDRQDRYVRWGWNLTGDAYVRDRDGYFWYQARTDDMIISAGYNIAGPEVEDALLRHPDVAEAAVVAAPDELRGSIVKAYVVLREGVRPAQVTAQALQAFVKGQIAPYKYPRAIEFRTSLPRTPTGKLQRFKLRQGSQL